MVDFSIRVVKLNTKKLDAIEERSLQKEFQLIAKNAKLNIDLMLSFVEKLYPGELTFDGYEQFEKELKSSKPFKLIDFNKVYYFFKNEETVKSMVTDCLCSYVEQRMQNIATLGDFNDFSVEYRTY